MRKKWTRALWLAGWLLVIGPAVPRAQQEAAWQKPPLLGRSLKELYLGLPPSTRVEYFRLDRLPLGAAVDRSPDPCGLVRWIAGPDPEDSRGWRVEIEATFFETGTRVVHTERLRPRQRELVFREIRAQAGRTLYLVWNPDEGLRSLEMMGGVLRREGIEAGRGALLPLCAIEKVRRGAALSGTTPVFQPLAGAAEPLQFSITEEGPGRQLELRRADDLLAGSYHFEGRELISFRWQDGGPVASRIDRRTYEGRLATRNGLLATQVPPVPAED